MVIWLHAFSTNSNPKVVAGYFVNEVKEREGAPMRIRSDMGTENSVLEELQRFLRSNHENSDPCYITGSSNHNQRIEQWWGVLRKHHAQYWMNIFQDLKNNDTFSGDFLDKNLLQFTCMEIIEKELQEVARLWNTHTISCSRNTACPRGKPLIMYRLPHLFGCTDHLKTASMEQIELCREEILPRGPYPCDESVFEICCLAMAENNLHPPSSSNEAVELYLFLRDYIHMYIV
ncbi:uncharacterized protein LOC129409478 [Boleophthalmus pectinirostris]|uniref:uncharacterized protein LOC129409478 n=1 Tax=Boleophthalmus pectinirostris TaxID=150288 RepID=UPI00242ED972|nr:uncharacterized protein LOC129409478 [Boleophthalmus pectinirostris]